MYKNEINKNENKAGFAWGIRTIVSLAFFTALYVVLERFLSINMWNMRIGFAFIALA